MHTADSDNSMPRMADERLAPPRQGGTPPGLPEGAAQQNSPKASASAPALAADTLYGAGEVAAFLFGSRKLRRKVYNLVEAGRLPHFRLGASICSRKSVLLDWIAAQEDSGALAASVTPQTYRRRSDEMP